MDQVKIDSIVENIFITGIGSFTDTIEILGCDVIKAGF